MCTPEYNQVVLNYCYVWLELYIMKKLISSFSSDDVFQPFHGGEKDKRQYSDWKLEENMERPTAALRKEVLKLLMSQVFYTQKEESGGKHQRMKKIQYCEWFND